MRVTSSCHYKAESSSANQTHRLLGRNRRHFAKMLNFSEPGRGGSVRRYDEPIETIWL
jgi:hypothetical protein